MGVCVGGGGGRLGGRREGADGWKGDKRMDGVLRVYGGVVVSQ